MFMPKDTKRKEETDDQEKQERKKEKLRNRTEQGKTENE